MKERILCYVHCSGNISPSGKGSSKTCGGYGTLWKAIGQYNDYGLQDHYYEVAKINCNREDFEDHFRGKEVLSKNEFFEKMEEDEYI